MPANDITASQMDKLGLALGSVQAENAIKSSLATRAYAAERREAAQVIGHMRDQASHVLSLTQTVNDLALNIKDFIRNADKATIKDIGKDAFVPLKESMDEGNKLLVKELRIVSREIKDISKIARRGDTGNSNYGPIIGGGGPRAQMRRTGINNRMPMPSAIPGIANRMGAAMPAANAASNLGTILTSAGAGALAGGAGSSLMDMLKKPFSATPNGAMSKGSRALRLAGKAALPITALLGAIDGISGFKNAKELTGREDPNFINKLNAAVGSIVSGLTVGLIDAKTATQFLDRTAPGNEGYVSPGSVTNRSRAAGATPGAARLDPEAQRDRLMLKNMYEGIPESRGDAYARPQSGEEARAAAARYDRLNSQAAAAFSSSPSTAARGSIANLVSGAESGSSGYNAYNRGTANGAILGPNGPRNLENMTVKELMDAQALPQGDANRIFAAGKYQVIPSTFREYIDKNNIDPNTKFDKNFQDNMFANHLIGAKRPDIRDYLQGKSSDPSKAVEALSNEFASFQGMDGAGKYGSGNSAKVTPSQSIAALNAGKQNYAKAIAEGKTHEEAMRAAVFGMRSESDGAAAKPVAGDSAIKMANQNASRNLDIKPELKNQLEYAAEQTGVKVEVTSGGQKEGVSRGMVGSTRHNDGGAADLKLYRVDESGNKKYLDMSNPDDQAVMQKFTTSAVKAGATGVGAGPGYMGNSTIHIGGGKVSSWGGADWIKQSLDNGLAEQKNFNLDAWVKERNDRIAKSKEPPKEAVTASQDPNQGLKDAGFSSQTPWGMKRDMTRPAEPDSVAPTRPIAADPTVSNVGAPLTPDGSSRTSELIAAGFTQGNQSRPMPAPGMGYMDQAQSAQSNPYSPIRPSSNTAFATPARADMAWRETKDGGKVFGPDPERFNIAKNGEAKVLETWNAEKAAIKSQGANYTGDDIRSFNQRQSMQAQARNDFMSGNVQTSDRKDESTPSASVQPGVIKTPEPYESKERESSSDNSDSGAASQGGSSEAASPSPSEIKSQPDDIGLNHMNTSDDF